MSFSTHSDLIGHTFLFIQLFFVTCVSYELFKPSRSRSEGSFSQVQLFEVFRLLVRGSHMDGTVISWISWFLPSFRFSSTHTTLYLWGSWAAVSKVAIGNCCTSFNSRLKAFWTVSVAYNLWLPVSTIICTSELSLALWDCKGWLGWLSATMHSCWCQCIGWR